MTAKERKTIVKLKELLSEIPHLRTLRYNDPGSDRWNSEFTSWRKRVENIISFALTDDDYKQFSRAGQLTEMIIMGNTVLQRVYNQNLTSCKVAMQSIIDKYEILEDDTQPNIDLLQRSESKSSNSHISDESYDVALSFAGEDREYVEEVADYLKKKGIRVFYDKYEEVNMWGKNLVEHLESVYRNNSRYCVIFISKHYVNNVYPTYERRSALAKAIQGREEYILPVRFDDTEVPGILPTVTYVDLKQKSPADLGLMIITKISKFGSQGVAAEARQTLKPKYEPTQSDQIPLIKPVIITSDGITRVKPKFVKGV